MQRTAEPVPAPSGADVIRVRGARVHNLKNVELDIPRNRLVVITGLSGSGKSSLAFDTIFAEGQRQYLESLSSYARQFMHQLERPDVDWIDGLQPTVAVDQRPGNLNPRSTVATVTEIYDHMRLLWARVGQPHCPTCGEPIEQQTPDQIVDAVLSLGERRKVMILAPFVRGRKGLHCEAFSQIRKAGFVRARIDGRVYDIDDLPELVRQRVHHIEAVVDRLVLREDLRPRLAEAIRLAVRHSGGVVIVSALFECDNDEEEGNRKKKKKASRGSSTRRERKASSTTSAGSWRDKLYNTQLACSRCGLSLNELEPRSFSFNSPYGACPVCDGLGYVVEFDMELVLPDRRLSIAKGAIAPWKKTGMRPPRGFKAAINRFAASAGFPIDRPLEELKPKQLEQLWRGDKKGFDGLLLWLEKQYATETRREFREMLDAFRGRVLCSECGGARLGATSRAVLVGGEAIHRVAAFSVDQAVAWFAGLRVPADQRPIARPILEEISTRLGFLQKVGLGYLTLDRAADTLSGGEAQRIRLASSLGSGLVGVCYVLDEPSIGLHPRDNQQLIEALCDLQQQGNTVLVVEHDEATMRQADFLIDLGPGAGSHGGHIVAQGTPAEVEAENDSLTGRYLAGRETVVGPVERRRVSLSRRAIRLEGVRTNNLKNVDVVFPLGTLTCVTGVSGSGKSSLVEETFARAVRRRLGLGGPKPGPFSLLRGVSQIDKLIVIDQTPIGRTPRSNPATYTGVFDEIRKVFAGTKQAKLRGYRVGRFSFNVKGGRCDECQGQGVQKIEMNFLPDLTVACPACGGARFNRQTLEIRYRGRSIADVLDMPVDEAVSFFENFPTISRLLRCLQDVGLGYLALGQPSTALSGGEAQRVKLATELGRADSGKTVYLLDEPTTGLHFDDVKRLLGVLGRLVDRGNTVIVIEHHLDVIKSADWVIDLGPEGGEHGGRIVGAGTPETIASLKNSHTGRALRKVLGQ